MDYMSLCNPTKIHKDKVLPYNVDIAIICFTPMPECFKQFEITHSTIRYFSENNEPSISSHNTLHNDIQRLRYFLHIHPTHVMFCKYKDINFIVISEVYGGPVAVSIVEELAFYGISFI